MYGLPQSLRPVDSLCIGGKLAPAGKVKTPGVVLHWLIKYFSCARSSLARRQVPPAARIFCGSLDLASPPPRALRIGALLAQNPCFN